MKKLILIICFVFLSSSLIMAKTEKKANFQIPNALAKEIQTWPKEQLEYLAGVYLELGNRFYELDKKQNSQACFLYAIQVYPIGPSAMKAKELLKKRWDIQIP